MKIFGSISRLVSVLFRKNSQDITLRPNQATTYTAARDIQFPEGDANHVLVSKDGSQTLTNKTIDGDDNTIQDLGLSSLKTILVDADKVLVRDALGAVSSAKLVNANVDSSAALDRSKLADGTADHVVINNGTGGLTSEANLAISRGGTGAGTASTALNNLLPTQTGNSGKVLSTDGAGNITWISNASSSSFSVDWTTGTSFDADHNLGSLNVLVQVYDKLDGSQILLDEIARATANKVTLTSSQAPGASGWKVLVLAI